MTIRYQHGVNGFDRRRTSGENPMAFDMCPYLAVARDIYKSSQYQWKQERSDTLDGLDVLGLLALYWKEENGFGI